MKSRLPMLGQRGRCVPRSKRGNVGVALVVAGLMLVVAARQADAEPTSCKREIARADARFSRAKMKALQKCYGDVVAGKKPGPCPDASAAARIFSARAKLQSSIAKRCGGIDRPAASRPTTIRWPPSAGTSAAARTSRMAPATTPSRTAGTSRPVCSASTTPRSIRRSALLRRARCRRTDNAVRQVPARDR